MPSGYSTADLLSIFKDVYQSVDIRWVAVREWVADQEKERWLLIAMSAHVCMDDGELASRGFRDDLDRIPGIESSAIRIFQRTFPVEEVQRLAEMVIARRLILDGMEFTLSEPRDILKQIGTIQPIENDALPRKWPRLQQEMGLSNEPSARQKFQNDFQFSRATELAGYKSPDAAVSRLLGVSFNSNSIGGFCMVVDVPLRMLTPSISKKGNKLILSVRVETHPAVPDVSCAGRISLLYHEERDVPVTRLKRLSEKGGIALWQAKIPLVLQRSESLEIDVLCDKAGRLYSRRESAANLLPIRLANPLFAALTMFCPSNKLLSLLTQPETAEPSKRIKQDNPATLFEISVQWLLSALGFQALWLHGYEISKEGKVQVGAVDCLAYSECENLLLLVNCSLGAPDPTELNQHAAFCTRVSKSFSADSNVKILSVLVTATSNPEGQSSNSPVVILYKNDLEKLLKAVESGRLVEFSRFTNPIFHNQFVE
jgi:hypothetical protein